MSAATYASPGGQCSSIRVRTGTHLSGERERRLVESLLLRVANVRVDDPLERKGVAHLELVAEVLRLDGELTADGVLHIEDGGVEVGYGELVHIAGTWRK